MRFLLACAILGVSGICEAGTPPANDFPTLVRTIRKTSGIPGAARLEFEQGVSSWDASRFLAARNHWVRAQAWMEKSVPEDSEVREAISELVEESNRLSTPEPRWEPEASPSPTPLPRRARLRSGREKRVPRASSAKKVMEQARAARKAGQIEKAARLMRIASTLPGGDEAAAEADALEQTVINGNGSGW